MNKDDLNPLQALTLVFGGCLGILLLLVVGTVFNGFALMYLWAWFMVVPFGLPALSLGQSIGVAGIVSYMTYQHIDVSNPEKSTGEKVGEAVGMMLARPILALVFGRIVYYFTYGQ